MIRGACALGLFALAGPVHAESPAPPPAAVSATGSDAPSAPLTGVALGVEVGEPTSVTVGWWQGKLGVAGAVGTGTLAGLGLSLHVDAQLVVARPTPATAVRLGLGGRYYHHGYEAMSFDEIPDSHYGVRASLGFAYETGALQLYAEVAPGVDVKRTSSCTLASGPYSICPHAQERPLFVQLAIGARWFFAR